MMKTPKIKTVRDIGRIRTLLVTLSVSVCLATLMGCSNSRERDIETLREAAEQGDAKTQHSLGLRYANGEGVPQDDAEAAKWWRMAAEQGHAASQFGLGVMYDFGMGVPQDYAEAEKWLRKAAEQGFDGAQEQLDRLISPIEMVFMEKSLALSAPYRDIDSLRNVVTQLQAIDTSKCPKDFRLAWLEHCQSWAAFYRFMKAADSRTMTDSFIEGFIRGIDGDISGGYLEQTGRLRSLQETVEATRDKCDRLAIVHGSRTVEQLQRAAREFRD